MYSVSEMLPSFSLANASGPTPTAMPILTSLLTSKPHQLSSRTPQRHHSQPHFSPHLNSYVYPQPLSCAHFHLYSYSTLHTLPYPSQRQNHSLSKFHFATSIHQQYLSHQHQCQRQPNNHNQNQNNQLFNHHQPNLPPQASSFLPNRNSRSSYTSSFRSYYLRVLSSQLYHLHHHHCHHCYCRHHNVYQIFITLTNYSLPKIPAFKITTIGLATAIATSAAFMPPESSSHTSLSSLAAPAVQLTCWYKVGNSSLFYIYFVSVSAIGPDIAHGLPYYNSNRSDTCACSNNSVSAAINSTIRTFAISSSFCRTEYEV